MIPYWAWIVSASLVVIAIAASGFTVTFMKLAQLEAAERRAPVVTPDSVWLSPPKP